MSKALSERKEGKQGFTAGAIERQLEAGDRLRSDASSVSICALEKGGWRFGQEASHLPVLTGRHNRLSLVLERRNRFQ